MYLPFILPHAMVGTTLVQHFGTSLILGTTFGTTFWHKKNGLQSSRTNNPRL